VNLNKVASVEPSFNHTYELTMTDGSKIPVSRSFITEMKQALGM
jgi:two-component system response regulator LytT